MTVVAPGRAARRCTLISPRSAPVERRSGSHIQVSKSPAASALARKQRTLSFTKHPPEINTIPPPAPQPLPRPRVPPRKIRAATAGESQRTPRDCNPRLPSGFTRHAPAAVERAVLTAVAPLRASPSGHQPLRQVRLPHRRAGPRDQRRRLSRRGTGSIAAPEVVGDALPQRHRLDRADKSGRPPGAARRLRRGLVPGLGDGHQRRRPDHRHRQSRGRRRLPVLGRPAHPGPRAAGRAGAGDPPARGGLVPPG